MAPSGEFRIRALCTLSRSLWCLGRGGEQAALIAEAERDARTLADPVVLSQVLQTRTDLELAAGRDASAAVIDEAFVSARRAADEWEIANASYLRALALPGDGQHERVDRAASLLEAAGNLDRLGDLLVSAAYEALLHADDRHAHELIDRAVPIAGQLDNRYLWMGLHGNRGLAALLTGDVETATEAFRQELRLCRELVVRPFVAEGLQGLAAVAATCNDLARAARLRRASARRYGRPDDAVDARLETVYFGPARTRGGATGWKRHAYGRSTELRGGDHVRAEENERSRGVAAGRSSVEGGIGCPGWSFARSTPTTGTSVPLSGPRRTSLGTSPPSPSTCACVHYEQVWQPLAIYAGVELVGFVMWAVDPEDGSYWIEGGLTVDRVHQSQGRARAAMAALVERFRDAGAVESRPLHRSRERARPRAVPVARLSRDRRAFGRRSGLAATAVLSIGRGSHATAPFRRKRSGSLRPRIASQSGATSRAAIEQRPVGLLVPVDQFDAERSGGIGIRGAPRAPKLAPEHPQLVVDPCPSQSGGPSESRWARRSIAHRPGPHRTTRAWSWWTRPSDLETPRS